MQKIPSKIGLTGVENYENNYMELPFENIMREYRKKNILEIVNRYPHSRFLEIGCGADPLFMEVRDFTKMIVVEPGQLFYQMAIANANENPNIRIINDLIENITDKLHDESFDFIVIGGFLHEIKNPVDVLQAVRKIATKNTLVYSFVPNAKSFHRLLAYEMGIIESINQKSGHDKLFQRQKSYDPDTFNKLLTDNEFSVVESGSYFIKPFTHDQMNNLLSKGIVDKNCLDGLDKMKKYFPDLGAEIYNVCRPQ